MLKKVRLALVLAAERRLADPIDYRKLYAAKARAERARKTYKLFVAKENNPSGLPACDYCRGLGHDDTPCPSRTVDSKRFRQSDRKP
jgi:hypothetical protein